MKVNIFYKVENIIDTTSKPLKETSVSATITSTFATLGIS